MQPPSAPPPDPLEPVALLDPLELVELIAPELAELIAPPVPPELVEGMPPPVPPVCKGLSKSAPTIWAQPHPAPIITARSAPGRPILR
jgi:hypothetical protein